MENKVKFVELLTIFFQILLKTLAQVQLYLENLSHLNQKMTKHMSEIKFMNIGFFH